MAPTSQSKTAASPAIFSGSTLMGTILDLAKLTFRPVEMEKAPRIFFRFIS
jgi:hypothetical protein